MTSANNPDPGIKNPRNIQKIKKSRKNTGDKSAEITKNLESRGFPEKI